MNEEGLIEFNFITYSCSLIIIILNLNYPIVYDIKINLW